MRLIMLSDDTKMEVKINFLTIKILDDYGLEKIEKELKNGKKQFPAISEIIYAILRSNGRKVDHEEALMLVPLDNDVIFSLVEEFADRLKEFKKKQGSKIQKVTK